MRASRGLSAYEAGDMAATLEALSQYVARERDDVEVLLAFAEARRQVPLEQGAHIVEAMGYYKHALKLLDEDASQSDRDARQRLALTELVDIYGLVGLRFERIQAAGRLLQSEPDSIEALSARAEAYFGERQFDKALKDIEHLTTLQPRALEWRSLQLETLARQGRHLDEQLDLCSEWIETYPNESAFLVLKSMLLANAGAHRRGESGGRPGRAAGRRHARSARRPRGDAGQPAAARRGS